MRGMRYPTPSPVPDRSKLLMSRALYADSPSTFSPAAAAWWDGGRASAVTSKTGALCKRRGTLQACMAGQQGSLPCLRRETCCKHVPGTYL